MSAIERSRSSALSQLDVLVGDWTVTVDLPGTPIGKVTFEWTLDGQFLLQRSTIDDPVPDSVAVIAVAPGGKGYVQHYFDARGVVRTYGMTLDGGMWTLRRDEPDFSPLHFAQRFTGTFGPDDTTITATWDARDPGEDWRLDFPLTYTRERGVPSHG